MSDKTAHTIEVPEVLQKADAIRFGTIAGLGLEAKSDLNLGQLWQSVVDKFLATPNRHPIGRTVLAHRMFAAPENCEDVSKIAARHRVITQAVTIQEAKLLDELATLWKIALLEADREHLRSRVRHLESREAHFAKVLNIPDAGRFRTDWDVRLQGAITRSETLTRENADLLQLVELLKRSNLQAENRADRSPRDPQRSKILRRRPL